MATKPKRPEEAKIQAGPGGPPPEEVGAANEGFEEAQDMLDEGEEDDGVEDFGMPEFDDEYDPLDGTRPSMRDEDDEVLFAPPEGVRFAGGRTHGRMPSDIIRYLPLMAEAAARPDAPASLRNTYRAIVRQLAEELRGT